MKNISWHEEEWKKKREETKRTLKDRLKEEF